MLIYNSTLPCRLSEKEERCDSLQEMLHYKEKALLTIERQQSRHDREGSAKITNLNQALAHAKQTCSELSEENDSLKDKQRELLDRVESMERERDALQKKLSAVQGVNSQKKDSIRVPCTPVKVGGARHDVTTPVKPLPEETRLDILTQENSKLRQELQCLQTNFQITCNKSSQMKKEMKEMEKAMGELQVQYDRTLDEKEDIQQKFEEAKADFANQNGTKQAASVKNEQLSKEIASLQAEVESIQRQGLELQAKLKKEHQLSVKNQDTVELLKAKVKTLTAEKTLASSELKQSQAMLQSVREELADAQTENFQLQSSLKQRTVEAAAVHKCKVDALNAEKLDLKEQLETTGKSLDDAMTELQNLRNKEASLLLKVASLEAKNASHCAQRKDNAHLSDEMHALRTKLAELSEQLEEANAKKSEVEDAMERVKAQVQDLSNANKNLSEDAKSNWEQANQLQKELEKVETVLLEAKESSKEKDRECTKLQCEVDDLLLKLSSAESHKGMYEAEVDRLMKKLDELEMDNFELRAKLNGVESESNSVKLTIGENEARVIELESTVQLLEETLLERDSIISDLSCANELMKSENAVLVTQVTSLSEMVSARNSKVDTLHSQQSMYESEIRDIVEKIAELETSRGQCKVIRQDLEREIETLKESLEVEMSKMREADSTIFTMKLKVMDLEDSNGSLNEIIASMQGDTDLKLAKSEEVSLQNTELRSRVHTLKLELDSKDASLTAAREETEYLKKCLVDTECSLKAEIESLDEKCNDLREQLDTSEQTKIELTSQIAELKVKLREERHMTSTLQGERHSASERLSFVQTELNAVTDELIMVKSELRNTKSSLDYQERKLSEASKEKELFQEKLETITDEYETLRETALAVLEQPGTKEDEGENDQSLSTSKKPKGILKNPSRQRVLQPVENLC